MARRPQAAWRILGRKSPEVRRVWREYLASGFSARTGAVHEAFTHAEWFALLDRHFRAQSRLKRRVYLRGVVAEAEFHLEVLGRRAARELQLDGFKLPRTAWRDVHFNLSGAADSLATHIPEWDPLHKTKPYPPFPLRDAESLPPFRRPLDIVQYAKLATDWSGFRETELGRLIRDREDNDLTWAAVWTATGAAVAAAALRDPRAELRFEYAHRLTVCQWKRAVCARLPEILQERPDRAASVAAKIGAAQRNSDKLTAQMAARTAAVAERRGRLRDISTRGAARILATRGVEVLQPDGRPYMLVRYRRLLKADGSAYREATIYSWLTKATRRSEKPVIDPK